MRARLLSPVLGALALCAGLACKPALPPQVTPAEAHGSLEWASWSPEAFARAQTEQRLILLNVVASWCHWCHVMDEQTYANPEVAALLAEHFVVLRVDSDARPDIAERYQPWGWPATAILSPDAEPVLNLRGFQAPEDFASLLRELVDEQARGELRQLDSTSPSNPSGDLELAELRARAEAQLDGYFDEQGLGWGSRQKYPWPGPVEYALLSAHLDPAREAWRPRALATLEAAEALIDPVWGGMYQYSLRSSWDHPHYEKITMIQAGAMENYAHAAMITGDGRYLAAAQRVLAYMLELMQDPDGGFYTSQDADLRGKDAQMVGASYYALPANERRKLGMPRIDRAVYADLNGLMIHALSEYYCASEDPDALEAARRAAERILLSHRHPRGGLRHGVDAAPDQPRYLADQAAIAWGLLALYRVSGERRWRDEAEVLAGFMSETLADTDGGLFAHEEDPAAVGVFSQRRKPLPDNALAAQVFIELHMLLDGDGSTATPWLERARAALLAVSAPKQVRGQGKVVGRYLYALALLEATKFDFSVVAEAGDRKGRALHEAALRVWEPRASIEWSEPGTRYPDIGQAALYLCSDRSCSPPLDDPRDVASSAQGFFADY